MIVHVYAGVSRLQLQLFPCAALQAVAFIANVMLYQSGIRVYAGEIAGKLLKDYTEAGRSTALIGLPGDILRAGCLSRIASGWHHSLSEAQTDWINNIWRWTCFLRACCPRCSSEDCSRSAAPVPTSRIKFHRSCRFHDIGRQGEYRIDPAADAHLQHSIDTSRESTESSTSRFWITAGYWARTVPAGSGMNNGRSHGGIPSEAAALGNWLQAVL